MSPPSSSSARRRPASTSTRVSSKAPATKKTITESTAPREEPVVALTNPEQERPQDAGHLVRDREEAEELAREPARDEAREERARERLGPALDQAHQHRQRPEVRRGPDVVPEHAPRSSTPPAPPARRAWCRCARPAPANRNASRDAHELHQQDGADERAGRQPELRAVDCGHPDDGADAVVVEQERRQHEDRLAVPAQVTEGVPEADKRLRGPFPGRRPPRPGVGSGTRRNSGIVNAAHQIADLTGTPGERAASRPPPPGRTTPASRSAGAAPPGAGPRRGSRGVARRSRRDPAPPPGRRAGSSAS